MLLRIAAACAAMAGLAACGGSGGQPAGFDDNHPQVIAKLIGCTHIQTDNEPELYMANEIDCRYRGTSTSIGTFASSAAEASWKKFGDSIGGADGTVVIGNGFAVEANDGINATRIAKIVHGTVDG